MTTIEPMLRSMPSLAVILSAFRTEMASSDARGQARVECGAPLQVRQEGDLRHQSASCPGWMQLSQKRSQWDDLSELRLITERVVDVCSQVGESGVVDDLGTRTNDDCANSRASHHHSHPMGIADET